MEKNRLAYALVLAVCANNVGAEEPLPYVEISEFEMPQYVSNVDGFATEEKIFHAVVVYHQLRKSFNISHTTMGKWLGVKRRSLYNWMNDPESAIKYGEQIEHRLKALAVLEADMEPEHRPLLSKIAFSPIYGDPEFGVSIFNGQSDQYLLKQYDGLFSQFESYRRMVKKKPNMA